MSLSSKNQIETQVRTVLGSTSNKPQFIALRSALRLEQDDEISIGGQSYMLLPCSSDLQAREGLMKAGNRGMPAILLCDMDTSELADDVLDRIAKQRIIDLQTKEVLASFFQVSARLIDPRINKNKELMEALVEYVPPRGYPPVASGMLTLHIAWTSLLSQLLETPVTEINFSKIFEWGLDQNISKALMKMPPGLRTSMIDWMTSEMGELVGYLFAAFDSGNSDQIVPLGLTLSTIQHQDYIQSVDHQVAKGRFEKFISNRTLPAEMASVWSRAAQSWITEQIKRTNISQQQHILNRLDDFLAEIGIQSHAWTSNFSPAGFNQRFTQLGQALLQSAKSTKHKDYLTAHQELQKLKQHHLAQADTERTLRAEMALRLVAWLQSETSYTTASGLPQMIDTYAKDGGYVDWARNRLQSSDESEGLAKAYIEILKRVDSRAERFEEDFAAHLAEWTQDAQTSSSYLAIENVIGEVLAPLSNDQPTLLLVLDGMSQAVYQELIEDVLTQNWSLMENTSLKLPKPVQASLPSITAVSRRALLCGELDFNASGTEEGRFKEHKPSESQSSTQAACLFRMGALSEADTAGLSSEVKTALANKKKFPMVGIVLNAIDDHLDSGKQVDLRWTRDAIIGLREIMRLAADAGRVIVLTSDHGHILDQGSKQLPSGKVERGDRFRQPGGELMSGEIEFRGPRIKQATGKDSIVLACSSKARYGGKKRGYHGGGNPQEVVVPLAILCDTRNPVPEGWSYALHYHPDWWSLSGEDPISVEVKSKTLNKMVKGLDLFEAVKTTDSDDWINELLSCEIYQEQSKLTARGALEVTVMTKFLSTFQKRGGSLMKSALAQELGIPPFRIDGQVQYISRILNVDGYDVLTLDRESQTVKLDLNLLKTQFDLKSNL